MHDPGGVRRRQPVGHLSGDRQKALRRDGALGQDVAQRRAFDDLHDDVEGPQEFPDVVDRHDVRVVER